MDNETLIKNFDADVRNRIFKKLYIEELETFEERHRRLSLPVSFHQKMLSRVSLKATQYSTESVSTMTRDLDDISIDEEANNNNDDDDDDDDDDDGGNNNNVENFKNNNNNNHHHDPDDPDDDNDDDDDDDDDDEMDDNSGSQTTNSPRLQAKCTENGFKDFACRDLKLAKFGREEIDFVKSNMHGLKRLEAIHDGQRPLDGLRLTMITHINAQTASTIEILIEFGAMVRLAPCNIYSTHNSIVAAMVCKNIPVFGWYHQTEDDFWWCIDKALNANNWSPNILFDNGGDATRFMIEKYPDKFAKLLGVIDESMSGIHRLFMMWKKGKLNRPAINLYDSIGQGVFNDFYLNRDNIVFTLKDKTDIFMAGSKVIVIGFGKVGRSTALGLRSVGCRVDIVEVNSVAALMATMDGFNVVHLEEQLKHVDIIITATGSCKIISRKHCDLLKSGSVLLNIGHYSGEIDVDSLRSSDLFWRKVRTSVDEIIWPNGKRILLLNQGYSLNLATQHSSSFVSSINATLRIMAILELFQTNNSLLSNELYRLTESREEQCASLHLPSDVRLTVQTDEQKHFNHDHSSTLVLSQNCNHFLRF